MSWRINAKGTSEEVLATIAHVASREYNSYLNDNQFAIVEKAAEFLRQVVAVAPVGATFDFTFGGHTDDYGAGGDARFTTARPLQG